MIILEKILWRKNKLLNIDVGGAKNRIMNELWKVMDSRKSSEFVYDLNSMKPFELKDNSVDNYYSSMILEHLDRVHLEFVLSEIYRTLKPGGMFRVVVPDINVGVKFYLNQPEKLFTKGCPYQADEILTKFKAGRLISWFYSPDISKSANGHKMAFDFELLSYFLKKAKFSETQRSSFHNCIEIFMDRDHEKYKHYALYVNVIK